MPPNKLCRGWEGAYRNKLEWNVEGGLQDHLRLGMPLMEATWNEPLVGHVHGIIYNPLKSSRYAIHFAGDLHEESFSAVSANDPVDGAAVAEPAMILGQASVPQVPATRSSRALDDLLPRSTVAAKPLYRRIKRISIAQGCTADAGLHITWASLQSC